MNGPTPQDRLALHTVANLEADPWTLRVPVFEDQGSLGGMGVTILEPLCLGHLPRIVCRLGILILVFACAIPSVRAASELPITLTWSAPAGCPDESAFRREIRGRIALTVRPTLPIEAHVVITPAPENTWQLELRTRVEDHEGERTIRHEVCAHLAEAAALVIALLIDPHASMVALPPPPPPLPTLPSAPIVTPSIPRWAVGADVLAGVGVVPGTSLGGRLRFGFCQRFWGLHVRFGGWREGTVKSRDLPGAGGTFSFYDFSGGPCILTSTNRAFGAQACAGVGLERMRGVSFSVSNPGSATAWMLGYHLESSIRYRVTSRIGFRGFIEGALRPSRPAFAIRGLSNLYRPALCSVKAGLGVDFLF